MVPGPKVRPAQNLDRSVSSQPGYPFGPLRAIHLHPGGRAIRGFLLIFGAMTAMSPFAILLRDAYPVARRRAPRGGPRTSGGRGGGGRSVSTSVRRVPAGMGARAAGT